MFCATYECFRIFSSVSNRQPYKIYWQIMKEQLEELSATYVHVKCLPGSVYIQIKVLVAIVKRMFVRLVVRTIIIPCVQLSIKCRRRLNGISCYERLLRIFRCCLMGHTYMCLILLKFRSKTIWWIKRPCWNIVSTPRLRHCLRYTTSVRCRIVLRYVYMYKFVGYFLHITITAIKHF